ncbi:MAG: protein disulfide isomerase family protein [Sulfurimonas sp.]
MALIEVNGQNFHDVLANEFSKGNTVILKFVSPYCDACMALGFELEEIEEEREDVSVLEIDCTDSAELAEMYDVMEVPTMVIYRDAQNMLLNATGVMMEQDIEEIIDSF